MTLCQQRFTSDKELSHDEGLRSCTSVGGLYTRRMLGIVSDMNGSSSLFILRARGQAMESEIRQVRCMDHGSLER